MKIADLINKAHNGLTMILGFCHFKWLIMDVLLSLIHFPMINLNNANYSCINGDLGRLLQLGVWQTCFMSATDLLQG